MNAMTPATAATAAAQHETTISEARTKKDEETTSKMRQKAAASNNNNNNDNKDSGLVDDNDTNDNVTADKPAQQRSVSKRNYCKRCRSCCTICVATLAALLVLIAALLWFPRVHDDANDAMVQRFWQQQQQQQQNDTGAAAAVVVDTLRAMSFNIRLDAWESDARNHFTKRVHRLAHTITTLRPHLVGMQEPFAGQLLHLGAHLPARYKALGRRRTPHHIADMGDARVHDDYKCAILYDTEKLELLEQDYLWLSETPRVPLSKSWHSAGIRVLNIARFRMRATPSVQFIAFNTHLDVRSEHARREQAALVARTIATWQQRYPQAAVVLTGDFNAAVGQTPYRVLSKELRDAWTDCHSYNSDDSSSSSPPPCVTHDYAHTFHGWLGSWPNSYLGRAAQYVMFTAHGAGLRLPWQVPTTVAQTARALLQLCTTAPQFSAWDAMPQSLARQHVDWVLYDAPAKGAAASSAPAAAWTPTFAGVMDVRTSEFSSDHFPVLVSFAITQQQQQQQTQTQQQQPQEPQHQSL
jgi:endonuclease/exonuclease/phosphatase family metal-dependent hydrolase